MSLTTTREDPGLYRTLSNGQQETYLVLSEEERAKGFLRPVRRAYVHTVCGSSTRMGGELAETWARNPTFYSATFCVRCGTHQPVGDFTWLDNPCEVMGSEVQK